MTQLLECWSRDISSTERRRDVRYDLQIPVVFIWDADGTKCQGEGMTRDISKVDVEILFGRSKSNVSLRGSMQVLRVEAGLNRTGVCGFALSGKRLSVGGAAQA